MKSQIQNSKQHQEIYMVPFMYRQDYNKRVIAFLFQNLSNQIQKGIRIN